MEFAALVVLVVLVAWREHRVEVERAAWRAERSELLDRIKPETAPAPMLGDAMPAAVDLFDDEDHWSKVNA